METSIAYSIYEEADALSSRLPIGSDWKGLALVEFCAGIPGVIWVLQQEGKKIGTEAVWIPLAISALGAGTAAYETDRTLKKQDRAAASGIRDQAGKQREADQRVAREVQQIEQSDAEAERRASNDQFVQQLQRNRAAAGGALPNVAGASGRYGQDLVTAGEDSDTMAARVADLMSRIDAPWLQRQREGIGFGRLATDLGQIGRASAGQDWLTQLRVRGLRENPWVLAGAGLAQGAGASMASSGFGGGTTGAGTTAGQLQVPVSGRGGGMIRMGGFRG